MDLPANLLKRYTTPKAHAPRNEREEMMQKFLERLNASRVKAKLKPLTFPRLAKMLQGKHARDLYRLYRECEEAKSFSALFWFKLKPKEK